MRTWVRVAVSSGVSRRGGLDPVLLWFWRRPAAVAPIGPLAWEPPHAAGVALIKKKKKINVRMGANLDLPLISDKLQGCSRKLNVPPNFLNTL